MGTKEKYAEEKTDMGSERNGLDITKLKLKEEE